MALTPLLGHDDPAPVGVRNGESQSPFFFICDHAGNAVPSALNGLGLPRGELDRHIGYDIGILSVTEQLADFLSAPLVFQRYSRLVVECNRRLTAPDSIALVSDGTAVPGNAGLDPVARETRIRAIAEPYHREIVSRLDKLKSAGMQTILISMHSFTPSLLARPSPRPWQIGLCYGPDQRFSRSLLEVLDRDPTLNVGRNEPYDVDMERSYSIPVHGEERGLPYAEVEIRQDLITSPAGQKSWAERMMRVLRQAHSAFMESAH